MLELLIVNEYLLDDGKCAVDVVNSRNLRSDFASLSDISAAAERVMELCIDHEGSNARGGYIGNIGT